MSAPRFQIRSENFEGAPKLREPLNAALSALQLQSAAAGAGLVRLCVLEPVDILVVSNTPGNAPWPLRLTQVARAPLGVLLLRLENLTTQGAAGVPTSAVAITSQRTEAQTVFVDFISGLTLNSRYRLRLGILDGA
jgi:hypothetical protein